jgi:hypothetical protein
MTRAVFFALAVTLAACSSNPPPSTTGSCAGTRVVHVTNGGDEAVLVYALNGRTSTEIGAVPQGKKDLTVPPNVRATSFYATAISRPVFAGSPISATTDTRVTFVEECVAKTPPSANP